MKTNFFEPSAATWTSNGWKMRPGLSRHAGSGRNARKKNCPGGGPSILRPLPSTSDIACAIFAASPTVTPAPNDSRTKRSCAAASA